MNWNLEKDGTVRILSFQSKEVLDAIKHEGIYYADDAKKRERRDYSLDVEQLDGHQPVWGFALPYEYKVDDIYCGYMFLNFKCEMSLSESTLADFVCLELFVPSELVKLGLTHNACYFAVVFPYIKAQYLHRVYSIEYTVSIKDNPNPKAFIYTLPIVETVEVLNHNSIPTFEENFRTLSPEEYDRVECELTTDFPFKSYKVGKRHCYEDLNIEWKPNKNN